MRFYQVRLSQAQPDQGEATSAVTSTTSDLRFGCVRTWRCAAWKQCEEIKEKLKKVLIVSDIKPEVPSVTGCQRCF
ncbi:hypothetical protein MHYP_G00152590 [Metynnis hypsauchen]